MTQFIVYLTEKQKGFPDISTALPVECQVSSPQQIIVNGLEHAQDQKSSSLM